MIKLIKGDCLEETRKIESNIIDLTITSPPYDNLRDYEGVGVFDENIWKPLIEEIFRVTKDGGVLVWVVNDATIKGSETGTSFKQALFAKECGFNLHDTMIYQKTGFSNPSTVRYHQVFEYMFIFTKGRIKTFNPIKDRKNKSKKFYLASKRKKTGELTKINKDIKVQEFGNRFNVWTYKMGNGTHYNDNLAKEHPATFPDAMAREHILSWSNENDLVLDPLMGSGTVGKMCKKLNRNFIGIEKVEKYYKLSEKRIKNF